jgi:hypothetical protein
MPGSGAAAPSTGSTQPSAGPSTATDGRSPLASIQPCDLLSAAELSENQLTKTDSGAQSGSRTCTWHNVTADNGIGYVIGTDVRDSQGLKDINTNGYQVTDDPVGSHQGRLVQQTTGDTCVVVIGVGNSSRVDVVANGAGDVNQACTLANQFAKLVESKLPG